MSVLFFQKKLLFNIRDHSKIKTNFESFLDIIFKMLILSVCCTLLSILTLEHVGRKLASENRPSVLINYLAVKLGQVFLNLGRWCAKFGWIFEHLYDFGKEFFISCGDIVKSMINLLKSPWHFVYGYWEVIYQYQSFFAPFMTGVFWNCVVTACIIFLTRFYFVTREFCMNDVNFGVVCISDWLSLWLALGVIRVFCFFLFMPATSNKPKKITFGKLRATKPNLENCHFADEKFDE